MMSCQSAAASQAELPARSYLVDPTGQLTLEDVKAASESRFKAFNQAVSLGYTDDTVWLRLVVSPDLAAGSQIDVSRLVLRLTNPLLNDVRLYDPLQNNGRPIVTGDAHPNTQVELDLSSLTFVLPVGDSPREVYVSVRTSSSMVFSVVLESMQQAIQSKANYNLFAGLYLALLGVFLVLAVTLRVGRSDRVTNLFLIQQVLAIAWSLTLMGYTRQYVGRWFGFEAIDGFTNTVVIAYTFAVCQFGMTFISQFRLKRWARGWVHLPIITFTPLLLLQLLGQSRLALEFNAYGVILLSFLGMVMVLLAIDKRSVPSNQLPRWLVTLFFVLFGFATPLATSVTLTVEPIFQNAFVGFFFTTALAGMLMSTLLIFRARALAREAIEKTTALDLQQQRSHEQMMFLGMLAHEFKTPLSVLKIVVGSGQLDADSSNWSTQALRNLDALIDKCLQAESLMEAKAVSEPVLLDVQAMMADVVESTGQPARFQIQTQGNTHIRSDPVMVRIILANLIDNALKYAKPDTLIDIQVRSATAESVLARVSNAVGRAGKPDPDHVFDKYYRSAGAMSQSGSGLGLYLSKHIAGLLGGDLVYIPEGDTLCFEVNLPKQI